jgi:DNA-binding SARP family transcriptional activator
LAFSLAGIVALEAGEIDLARQLLEKSVAQWRRNGAKQNLAGTNLLLSHVYLLQGKENASNRLLRIAMGAAEAGQWINFWEWHEETIYIMCWRSVLKNIHGNWAAHLLCRWFPVSSRQELAAFFASSNENYRVLASSLFHQLYEENSTNVIYAFYFNRFRVFINGLEIPKQAWKTQRAENLFKFLVANKSYYPKEEIIGQLWPDSDYKSGEANLRMTLSYVRKAIGVHGPVRESVIMERGKVYLSPKIEVFTDYELFEMKAQKALRHIENNSPNAVPALEQAVQLYRGDFLMEDIYDDWTNKIRTHLHALYLQLLLNLAHVYYNKNNLSSALQACREYLACEPVDEHVNRLTMRILWQTRKKRKAVSLYHELETTLASEYDTVPESETIDLYKKICTSKN